MMGRLRLLFGQWWIFVYERQIPKMLSSKASFDTEFKFSHKLGPYESYEAADADREAQGLEKESGLGCND